MRVGYVLRRYPRLRAPHVVEEILAHERAGLEVEIFSLRAPRESHFDATISRVRGQVSFLVSGDVKALKFWEELRRAERAIPGLCDVLDGFLEDDVADVRQAVCLARTVRDRGIDHLHAHQSHPAAEVARMAARMAGISYSFTSYAPDLLDGEEQTSDLSRIIGDATGVVAVSGFHRDALRARYPLLADRITRIPIAFDAKRVPYRAPGARSSEIVAVGSPASEGGMQILLDALAVLRRAGVVFRASVIASEYDAGLESRVDTLGLSERVEVRWTRNRSFIREKLERAAALVAPGLPREGAARELPRSALLHAMACGTPCVATDADDAGDLVIDAETGLRVEEREPASLASALARILADPALCVRLAQGARRRVESTFDADSNAARLREVFAADVHDFEAPAVRVSA